MVRKIIIKYFPNIFKNNINRDKKHYNFDFKI